VDRQHLDGTGTTEDSYIIRRGALDYHLPYTTTTSGAFSMLRALEEVWEKELGVRAIQEYFEESCNRSPGTEKRCIFREP